MVVRSWCSGTKKPLPDLTRLPAEASRLTVAPAKDRREFLNLASGTLVVRA
jgi:hypothetical protein